jgi:ribosomal protein L37AE/L43A
MTTTKNQPGTQQGIIAEEQRALELRKKTYRERALKIHPWVCAKCGREFTGKKLRELTVHHKDHNHDNNPPDGSNWELLCLYCHDNEHSRSLEAQWQSGPGTDGENRQTATYNPFAAIQKLVQDKGKK